MDVAAAELLPRPACQSVRIGFRSLLACSQYGGSALRQAPPIEPLSRGMGPHH
jgi:hypothetical protein